MLINYITFSLMIINIVAIAIVGWLLFHPVQLPIVYNQPFPTDKQEVKVGEEISYLIEINKTENRQVTINRNIICDDGSLVSMVPITSDIPLGKQNVWFSFIVPLKTSFGKCYLEMKNIYRINPVREEKLTFRTQEFTVIK